MRRQWFKLLHKLMKENKEIYVITADLGYGGFDNIMKDYPDRFFNVGASEQCMLATACGMAKKGKKVFCYSITPFLLWRGAEILRNYVNHEQYNICLVGSGRDSDYEHDGFSHYAGDDVQLMDGFTKIKSKWPENEEEMEHYTKEYLSSSKPHYINLTR